MKVVHVSTSDRGGAGIAASRLHLALLDQGVDSWFLTLHKFTHHLPKHVKFERGAGQFYGPLLKGVEKIKRGLKHYHVLTPVLDRMRHRQLSGRGAGFEHFSFPFAPIDLSEHPLIKSADIVNLHWVSDGFLDYKKYFTHSDKKIVWTLHDMNPFTGGCHHSDGCELFENSCKPCFQLQGTIDADFAGELLEVKLKALEGVNPGQLSIVTPSKWLGNLSSRSKLFKRFNHSVIRNGFNVENFVQLDQSTAREQLGITGTKKVIFINAHHIDNTRKGLNYLIKALSQLDKEKYLLMVAGHTMRTELFPNLFHLGYLNSEKDLSVAYSAADVFVLPSIAENLPNTICESLLCGTPVIAFDVGGIPELIDNENGKLVPLKDANALTLAIDEVSAQSWNHHAIREKAMKNSALPIIAKEYQQLYAKILSAK
jgi:glycosyltransferase involved in cell wall biosynthesis